MAELDLTQMREDIDKEMAIYNIGEDGSGSIHLDTCVADGMLYVDGEDKIPVQREIIAGDHITLSGDKNRTISAEVGLEFDEAKDGIVAAHSDNPEWKGVIGSNGLITEDYIKNMKFLSEADVVELIRKYSTKVYSSCGWYSTLPSGDNELKIPFVGGATERTVWTVAQNSSAIRIVGNGALAGGSYEDPIAIYNYSTGTISLPKKGVYIITASSLFAPQEYDEENGGRVEFFLQRYDKSQSWKNHFGVSTQVYGNESLYLRSIVDTVDFGDENSMDLRFLVYCSTKTGKMWARVNYDSVNIVVQRIE